MSRIRTPRFGNTDSGQLAAAANDERLQLAGIPSARSIENALVNWVKPQPARLIACGPLGLKSERV